MSVRIAPLGAAHLDGWAALFEAAHCACYCRYWHFEGQKNDWLERCAHDPDANRREQSALVAEGAGLARGLVALRAGADSADVSGPEVIGWMKLTPRDSLPKLRRLPVYRGLALGDDEGVYAIGCLLVHPNHRHASVANDLVAAADAFVLAWGGWAIEAYPRRASEPLHDEEAWMGPESLFPKHGYVAVHDGVPYPVYRKRLAGLV